MATSTESRGLVARPRRSIDTGCKIGVAGLFLLAISLLLPWWQLSQQAGGRDFAVNGGVGSDGIGWIVVAALFAITTLALLGRRLLAIVVASVAWFFTLLGVLVLALFNFPAINLQFTSQSPSFGPLVQTRLIGAHLALAAIGLLTIGFIVHAVQSKQYWDPSTRP